MNIDSLGRAIAVALAGELEQLEARIRELETQRAQPVQLVGWASPPKAAQSRGVSLRRVRGLVAAGAVKSRRKSDSAHARLEVRLADLDAVLAGESAKDEAQPIDAAAWARRKVAP